jgi:Alginate export
LEIRDTAEWNSALLSGLDAALTPRFFTYIGTSDWNNIARVFDAAKVRWQGDAFWVDVFSGFVTLPNDNHFSEPNYHDWFSGIYAATTRLIPEVTTELYAFSRNVSPDSATEFTTTTPKGAASPRDIYTFGMRYKSVPGAWKGWDYEGEIAGQLGRFKFSAASTSLEQEALAAHVAGGYTWTQAFGAPRLGLEHNYSSGDSDPTNSKHETFDNLFPTNHKFYGFMDILSWQNMHDLRLSASLKPLKKLALAADYHLFWLADTHDYFYTVSGGPRNDASAASGSGKGYGLNPSYHSFLGSELDLIATYALQSYASLQIGYGHFFTGSYIQSSLAAVGGSKDADWIYVQGTINF